MARHSQWHFHLLDTIGRDRLLYFFRLRVCSRECGDLETAALEPGGTSVKTRTGIRIDYISHCGAAKHAGPGPSRDDDALLFDVSDADPDDPEHDPEGDADYDQEDALAELEGDPGRLLVTPCRRQDIEITGVRRR